MMMLELNDVNAFYGDSQVLHGVSLEVPAGACTVLLGRNGAGKTTTLKTIIGEIAPKGGQVMFQGREITKDPTYRRSQGGLAYVASDASIFAKLSVSQNLALSERSKGGDVWNRDRVYGLLPALKRLEGRQAGVLSGGERQMLKLAMALLTEPSLILLDEPTQGVAPVVVGQIRQWLTGLLEEGMSLLLSEQNAVFAAKLGRTAYVIEKGTIVAGGSIEEMTDAAIVNKYLAV